MKKFQDLMYILLSSVHCYNGARSLNAISSHKVIIAFFRVLHSDIFVWCILGQLKSCIILNVVSVSSAYM